MTQDENQPPTIHAKPKRASRPYSRNPQPIISVNVHLK